MRVAHVLLSRGFAGTERATAEMSNAHSREHTVLLAIRRDDRRHGASILDHVSPSVEVAAVGRWFPQRTLGRLLERFQPDVIHAHLRRSTRLLSRIRPRAPAIATLHLTWNGPHFAAMDGIICIADWQRAVIPRDYPGQVFRINESLIPHRRLSSAERTSLRAELGAGPDHYLVGGVGRLAHSKGFDVLVRAFARARLPQARLAILGDGRERRRLQKLAGPGVQLAGYRNNVKDYYQAFDLFVSPSRSEPLGRVVLEAYDAGLPIIATRTLGPAELVQRHGGELVAIGDENELAAALERQYERRLEQAASLRVELGEFHIDTIAAQTLDAYNALLARQRSVR